MINGRFLSLLRIIFLRTFLPITLLGLITTPASQAQTPTQPPLISVQAQALLWAEPNEATFRFGIESRATTIDAAVSQNNDKARSALALLNRFRIPQADINTDMMNLRPMYDYEMGNPQPRSPNLSPKPALYVANKAFSVTVRDLSQLEKIMHALLEAGINTVHGLEFSSSQLSTLRDKARLSAIRSAKEKANAAAKELGVVLGRVLRVQIDDVDERLTPQSMEVAAMKSMGDQGPTVSGGKIAVRSSVSLDFLIQ